MQITLSIPELVGLIAAVLTIAGGFITFLWTKYTALKTQLAELETSLALYMQKEEFRNYMNGFRQTIEQGVREMVKLHSESETERALLDQRITWLEDKQPH